LDHVRKLVDLDGHAEAVGELPFHHRDPFDRMPIVQGRMEGPTIVTADRKSSRTTRRSSGLDRENRPQVTPRSPMFPPAEYSNVQPQLAPPDSPVR
jgi:hypothetical protein